MVSIDPYLNETTRHADVILPPPPPSRTAHFDVALSSAAVRNNARYSPPVFALPEGRPDEVTILCRLALGILGMGPDADPKLVDDQIIAAVLGKEVADPDSPVAGRDVEELTAMLPDGPGYERRLDMMLRLGPFGDAFGAKPDGLTPAATQGQTARRRPGSADAADPGDPPNPLGHSRIGAGADPRRPSRGCRVPGAATGRFPADRPTSSAVQQQLDAQPARAGRRHQPLHAADPPRRRRPAGRHRHRGGHRSRRQTRSAGGDHRRDPARVWCRCRTAGATPRRERGWRWPRLSPGSTSTACWTAH